MSERPCERWAEKPTRLGQLVDVLRYGHGRHVCERRRDGFMHNHLADHLCPCGVRWPIEKEEIVSPTDPNVSHAKRGVMKFGARHRAAAAAWLQWVEAHEEEQQRELLLADDRMHTAFIAGAHKGIIIGEDAAREAGMSAIDDLADAIRLTVEYVGNGILPAIEGWSWYDALKRHRPELAEEFERNPIMLHAKSDPESSDSGSDRG